MHASRSTLIAILAYGSSVAAAPAGGCNPIDAVYAILKGPLRAQASSLCLSYLGGDKTVQRTQTLQITGQGNTVTVTQPDQTQVATAEVTNVNRITRTDVTQAPNPTATVYVTVTAATRTVYQKRGIPPELAIFAAKRISSACSCIATPTTRTVFATQTQSVAGPQATATQPGRTVVVTITVTKQTTTEAVIIKTLPPTATPVQTIATTVTPILVKPKICNAKGLPGPNAFNYNANFNTNQAACIADCKTDPRCLSTGFYLVTDPSTGTTTGTCRHYDKSVTDSADLGFGYYNWNDKAC